MHDKTGFGFGFGFVERRHALGNASALGGCPPLVMLERCPQHNTMVQL